MSVEEAPLTAPDELVFSLAWLTLPSVCECVHEWVNLGNIVKRLLGGHWLQKKRYINAVQSKKWEGS
jgi:hypothetical protein